MQRSLVKRVGYRVVSVYARLIGVLLFRVRVFGRENIPAHGGGFICANHQSYFDPVLVGLVFNQRMNFLARSTLFRFPPFRWIIEFLDAIPIERDGMGMGGLKETLRRLKNGEFVLIFPEGTRTMNGEVASLKPGFCAVARRAKVPLIPVGFDGAFQAWPRNAKIPRPSTIHVFVGPPITPAEVEPLTDLQLVAELESRIRDCHANARNSRQSANRNSPELAGKRADSKS